jgi:diaminopimelate decarboxylase
MIMEPGRFIVGNAGAVITRVIRTKSLGGRNFVICDAGMNTLIRPALYGAFHRIGPVVKRPRAKIVRANIVGPICESGDFLGWDREITEPRSGDLLAVFSAGAYGYSMCSNYNSRSKPAEVLVSGSRQRLISRTETYEDLLRLESK